MAEKDILLILDILAGEYGEGAYPGRSSDGTRPDWERDPFRILIATMLSQRTRDDNTRKAADNLKPQGTFLAAALDSLGGVSAEERTAKATEAIVANTKKTNDLLKRGGKFVFA